MLKSKIKTPKLFVLALMPVMSAALFVFTISAIFLPQPHATALTSDTINFQARLLTAAGNVVPDGYYNVEFKLYSDPSSTGSTGGSCSGDAACEWVETRIGADKVRVANGYLTVNLGSVTSFGGTIPWDQQLWLTMNIGGTGSPNWDGEMNPRLKLTAAPYAFRSGGIVSADGQNTATLGNESGTICLQNSQNCGFAAESGSAGYIQNQNTSAQTTSNFWISGIGRASQLQAATFDTGSAGALALGTTNATSISLNQNTSISNGKSLTVDGGPTVLNGADIGDALTVSNSGSTGSIAIFKDGTESVFEINDGGEVRVKTLNPTSSAFVVANSSGQTLLSTDTFNNSVRLQTIGRNNTSTFDAIWMQGSKNGITTLIGGNDDTSGYAAADFSGSMRFNGGGVGWGDFAFFPTGNGDGNNGAFRFSTTGWALNTTPNAKVGTGDLFVNGKAGIGTNNPAYTLDVVGDINVSSGSSIRIGGVAICTTAGCGASAASAIQNQSLSTQTGSFKIDGTGTATTLQGTSSVLSTLFDTPTAGTLSVGTSTATAIILGSNTNNTAITLNSGTGAINIGTGAQARTINVGTGAAAQTVTVGSTNAGSSLSLNAASNLVLNTNSTTGGTTVKSNTNSTDAFRVVNSSDSAIIRADTANNIVNLLGDNNGKPAPFRVNTNNLNLSRYEASSVVVNGYIYTFGGSNSSNAATNNVQFAKLNADGSTGVWSTTQVLPTNLSGTSAVAYNGAIYVAGVSNSNIYSAIPNEDGTISSWSTAATNAAFNAISTRLVSYNGYLYLLANNTTNVYMMSMNWWNGTLGAVSVQSNIFSGSTRRDSSVAAYNGYIYVVSGRDDATVYSIKVNDTGLLDAAIDMGTLPDVRGYTNATIMNGHIYIFGGEALSASNSSNSVYHAPLLEWGVIGPWTSSANQMPATRSGAGITQHNGYMYVLGGWNADANPSHNNVWYTNVSRLQVGGSLDLTFSNADGSVGYGARGSITAGFGTFMDGLEIKHTTSLENLRVSSESSFLDLAKFYNDIEVHSDLTVMSGGGFFVDYTNGDVAFAVAPWMNAVGIGEGTRLEFSDDLCGSYACTSIEEDGMTDTEILRLQGNLGFKFGVGNTRSVYMRMDSSGRVLVGSGSESYTAANALTVLGDAYFGTSNNDRAFRIRTATGGSVDIEAGSTDAGRRQIFFSTWDSTAMNGVQTTYLRLSYGTTFVDTPFTVVGSGTTTTIESASLFLTNIPTIANSASLRQLCMQTTAGATNKRIYYANSGTTCGSSSARFKDNITSMSEGMGLDAIMALRPVTFTFKEGDQSTQIGLIAEEVNDVLPQLVTRGEDGLIAGINYEYMVANLIKGIQQQQVQINDLRSAMWSGGLISRDATFTGFVTFNGGVKFTSDVNFEGNTTFNGKVAFNENTTGSVTVPEGQTEIEVVFTQPYAAIPNISVSSSDFMQLKVKDKTVTGFKIVMAHDVAHDVVIDWIALQMREVAQQP